VCYCVLFVSFYSSLLDPVTGVAKSSSKMINSYIVPPEMTGLMVTRQGTGSDCVYCRDEADLITSYGTVSSHAARRRPYVVASLDADRTYSCGVAAPNTAAQWPVMTPDHVDSGTSRTPSISADDDLFISLPYRTSTCCQR